MHAFNPGTQAGAVDLSVLGQLKLPRGPASNNINKNANSFSCFPRECIREKGEGKCLRRDTCKRRKGTTAALLDPQDQEPATPGSQLPGAEAFASVAYHRCGGKASSSLIGKCPVTSRQFAADVLIGWRFESTLPGGRGD